MTANRSPAVMQQRARPAVRGEAHGAPAALDYFPTPPWATRALCEWLQHHGQPLANFTVWEPACGEMHLARTLAEFFYSTLSSDVHDYGAGQRARLDFLIEHIGTHASWIITNPPFKLADQFIHRALALAGHGVAMLLRTAFSEGQERYETLFAHTPPTVELQFAERVVMAEGRLVEAGQPDPFNLDESGEPKKASTATAYSWLVWLRDPATGQWDTDTRKRWLAPCRRRLERPGDYPAYPEQWAKIARDDGAML